jgi:Fe-S-cluster containining protein
MVTESHLPEHVTRLDGGQTFSFACHADVKCFTDCCRMLELALTPYDVLRLRKATGLSSTELLDEYIIIEQDPGEPFPRLYLTMVDDGRASCVFITPHGCSVYPHRPSACRAYPLGRAAVRTGNGGISEHFVLVRENHCLGFLESARQTPIQYSTNQELTAYNRFNDEVIRILQHDAIRKGFIPSQKQSELFVLALYNLDAFREMLNNDDLESTALSLAEKARLQNDEELLLFAIDLVHRQLFAIF